MGPVAPDGIRAVGIVGAGHSGTTIVYRMIALHPDATWLSQYSHRALLGPAGLRAVAGVGDQMMRRWFRHSWTKQRGARGWRRVIPKPTEAASIWDFLMETDDPASQSSRMRTTLARVCGLARRPTVIVKPPGRYRSRCAPIISSVFPRSRYIHVVRDGRAVAMSVSQKWLRRDPEKRAPVLRRGADHWTRALGQIQRYELTLPVAVIHYETLCADVHGELRRALEFVELDPDRFPYDACPQTLRSTNASRFQRAEPGDLAILGDLLVDDLRRYGYDSESL